MTTLELPPPQEELKNDSTQFKIEEIFQGNPEKNRVPIEEQPVNDADFQDVDFEEVHDNFQDGKKKVETEEEILEPNVEEVRKKELEDKGKEMRKKFVKMLNPKTIVGFIDMMLARVFPLFLTKTDKSHWRFDKEEKEFLVEALDLTIEEEGIEFWPAKYWLIGGFIFFLAMRFFENYMKFYTSKALEANKNTVNLEKMQQWKEQELKAIAAMEIEIEVLEQRKNIERKLHKLKTETAFLDEQEDKEITQLKERLEHDKKNEELRKQYPEDQFWWKDGELQYNQDGSPSKRRGTKSQTRRHPTLNRFISEEEFQELVDKGEAEPDEQ